MAWSSGDTMNNALKFVKLNGTNYRTWAFNMRLYLESLDLFKYADGSAVAPTGTEDSNDGALQRAFNSRAKKALAYICLAVEPEQQFHITNTMTAKEAWDSLKHQFARESILQKVPLRQQYYSLRFQSGGNMLAHINQLRSLHDQLKEMGSEINYEELAITLLPSLPEEFKPLLTVLDAVGEDNLSFEIVKGILLNDADRTVDTMNFRKADNTLSAKRLFTPHSRRGNHGRVSSSKNNTNKSDKVFNGTCHYCHEKGHFTRDCPRKISRISSTSSNFPKNFNSALYIDGDNWDDVPNEEALHTSDWNKTTTYGWIIDSGGTQHMTFDKASLSMLHLRNQLQSPLGTMESFKLMEKGHAILLMM